MTVKELSQLYYLKKLIQRDEQSLEQKRDNITRITPQLSGMPGKPGASDPVGDTVPDIVDLAKQIEEQKAEYDKKKAKLESYLNEIEDPQERLIFLLRFVDLKSWQEVADELGGNNTADSVKKVCYRYLKRKNQKVVPNVPNVPHVPPQCDKM